MGTRCHVEAIELKGLVMSTQALHREYLDWNRPDDLGTVIRARTPVRLDLAGGWTDVADFAQDTPGAVVNFTIGLWTYASLKSRPDSCEIEIFSADFDEYVSARDVGELEYNGRVDLVKAAVRELNGGRGLSIQTRSDAPPGSGLGTSAALGVALIGALGHYLGKPLLDFEVAELASRLEREQLGIKGGKQDHYASALGGLNFMEFYGEKVRTARIPISPATQLYLEKHLILVYTGSSRLSGNIHSHVWSNYAGKDPTVVGAIERMKLISRFTKDALIGGDIRGLVESMNENWQCQKLLHPSVTTPELDHLLATAGRNGAAGAKASGAGGGGCVILLAEPDQEHRVRRAVEQIPGMTVLPVSFQSSGLTVTECPLH